MIFKNLNHICSLFSVVYRPIDPFERALPYLIGSDQWKKNWHETLVESDHEEEMDEQDKYSDSQESNITPNSSLQSNSATVTESETWSQNHHRHSQDNVSTSRSTNSLEEHVYHSPQPSIRQPQPSHFMPTSLFASDHPPNDNQRGKQKGLFEESDDEDIFKESQPSTSKTPTQNIPANLTNSFFRDQKVKPQPVNIFNDEPPSDPIVQSNPQVPESASKKPTNLFIDDEDEDVGFANSINFSPKSKPKKISLFDDQPPSDEESVPIKPPTVRVMPEKVQTKPKVPVVDLFNDNDFDSFIQKIEKKPEQKMEPPKQTRTEIKIEKKVAPKITNLFDDEPETDYFEELLKNKTQSKEVKTTSEKFNKPSISAENKNTILKKGLFDEDLNESGSDLFAPMPRTRSLFNEPPKQKNLFENSTAKRDAFEDLFSSKNDNLFDDKPAKVNKKLDNKEVSKSVIKPVSFFNEEPPLDFGIANNEPVEQSKIIPEAKREPVKTAIISKTVETEPLVDEQPPLDFSTSTKTTIVSQPKDSNTEKKENSSSIIVKPTPPLFEKQPDDIFDEPPIDVFAKSEIKKSSLFDDLPTVEAPKVTLDQSPPADSISEFIHTAPPQSKNVSAMFLDEEPPEDLEDTWETEADGDSDDSKPSFVAANQSALSFSSSLQLFDDLPPPDDFDSLFSKSNKQSISSKMFLDYDEDDTTNSPRTSSLSSLSSPIGILSDEPPPDDEIDTSFRKNMDLFKNNATVDKPDEIREKTPPKKLNMNFNAVADKTEEIKDKPSPKKLNMNFNINVNALLPGARPPLNKATNFQSDSPKLNETNESSSSLEDSIKESTNAPIQESVKKIHEMLRKESTTSTEDTFQSSDATDSNNNTRLLNNDMAKSRAKIGIKRRPSTKRGRQATLQRVLTTQDILDGNLRDFENTQYLEDDNGNSENVKNAVQKPIEAQKSFLGELEKKISNPVRSMSISEESYSPIKDQDSPDSLKPEFKAVEPASSIIIEESLETESFIEELKRHSSASTIIQEREAQPAQIPKSLIENSRKDDLIPQAKILTNNFIEDLQNKIDSVKQLPNVTSSNLSTSLFEEGTTDIKDIPQTNNVSPSKNFTTNKISVFYDDEDDILDMLAKNKRDLESQEVPAKKKDSTPIKHVTADIFQQKSNAISSALFDDALFNKQVLNVSARNVSKSSLNTSIFDDGDDDLFGAASSNPVPNTLNKAVKITQKANPPKTATAESVKQKSSGLFEDDLSDDDLFQVKPVTKKIMQKPSKVFEDESDDDDLFGTKVGGSAKAPKLFGSDEEQESKKNIFSAISKINKEMNSNKKPVQQKSLFGEEELDDDLFATKSKKGN